MGEHMSRSRRRNPHFGNTTAASEREDKRRAHKKLRRRMHWAARRGLTDSDEPLDVDTRMRSVSERLWWPKDGRSYRPHVADDTKEMSK